MARTRPLNLSVDDETQVMARALCHLLGHTQGDRANVSALFRELVRRKYLAMSADSPDRHLTVVSDGMREAWMILQNVIDELRRSK